MLSIIPLCLAASALGQPSLIRVNQVGYAANRPKLAVLLVPADTVRLIGSRDDFSSFRTPGTW